MLITQLLKRLVEAPEPNDQEEVAIEPAAGGVDELMPVYGTYMVSFNLLGSFLEKLEQINTKAAKLGIPPLTIASRERVSHTEYRNGRPHQVTEYRVVLNGEPMRIKGWRFLATLEHINTSNVIRGVPGEDLSQLQNYVTASNHNCDFCHSKRDRNNTYVIQNDEGELKQVGGQCLKKFLGDGAAKLVRYAFSMPMTLRDELDDDEHVPQARVRRRQPAHDVMAVLIASAAMVRTVGYRKVDSVEDLPTSACIKHVLYNIQVYVDPHGYDPQKRWAELRAAEDAINNPTPEDQRIAEEAFNWFSRLPDAAINSSNFFFSLSTIFTANLVTPKNVGIAAALIPVYVKEKNKQDNPAPAVAAPPKPVSVHVGAVGQKIPSTEMIVSYVTDVSGPYGDSQLVKAADHAGNQYSWFSARTRVNVGDVLQIAGTVKSHEEYKGKLSTRLTRVKHV